MKKEKQNKPDKIKSLIDLSVLEEKANILAIKKNKCVAMWQKAVNGNGMEKAADYRKQERIILLDVKNGLIEKLAELDRRIGNEISEIKEEDAFTIVNEFKVSALKKALSDFGKNNSAVGKIKWTIQAKV